MTRAARVSIELFTPPLLGATPFLLMALATWTPGVIPVILLVAYVVATLPSMVFSAVLEFTCWGGLGPRSWTALLLAAGLGLGSGLAIGLIGGTWTSSTCHGGPHTPPASATLDGPCP